MAKRQKRVKKPTKPKRVAIKTTVNIKSLCKENTELNISGAYVTELKHFVEDALVPTIIKMSERYAIEAGRKTLTENDLIRARDFIWHYVDMISKQ